MNIEAETRPLTQAEKMLAYGEAKRAALIEEIEFFIMCDVGEAGILQALGYTRKGAALKRQLHRCHRPDLIPRIFEADTLYRLQHADMGIGKATARKART